jgi:hypothetical protein
MLSISDRLDANDAVKTSDDVRPAMQTHAVHVVHVTTVHVIHVTSFTSQSFTPQPFTSFTIFIPTTTPDDPSSSPFLEPP